VRFGLHLPNSGELTADADLVAMARNAEQIGFDRVWVYDHLFNPVELSAATRETRDDYYNKADMPYYDALTTLAVVAGATATIGIGTRVMLPVLRPPAVLAKQVGSLAVLAGEGRLVLGVGAGWLIEEYDAVGIDASERFARLDEHVAFLKAALAGGVVSHEGRFYTQPPAGFLPVPSEPIPIVLGGTGPITMRRVARWADGWAMPPVEAGPESQRDLDAMLDRLSQACDAEGRDPATVRLVGCANLSDPPSHYEMLAEAGVDDVDVMLTTTGQLDLAEAAEFFDRVARQLS
jgi:probable F420-dependent oxidoreductase